LLAYQVMMYFYLSPELNLERLYLPTLLRTAGYAIYFTVFLLPQLTHFINLLIIKCLSACQTVQYYRNITATLPQTLPQMREK
jgi:hypothetical protein